MSRIGLKRVLTAMAGVVAGWETVRPKTVEQHLEASGATMLVEADKLVCLTGGLDGVVVALFCQGVATYYHLNDGDSDRLALNIMTRTQFGPER